MGQAMPTLRSAEGGGADDEGDVSFIDQLALLSDGFDERFRAVTEAGDDRFSLLEGKLDQLITSLVPGGTGGAAAAAAASSSAAAAASAAETASLTADQSAARERRRSLPVGSADRSGPHVTAPEGWTPERLAVLRIAARSLIAVHGGGNDDVVANISVLFAVSPTVAADLCAASGALDPANVSAALADTGGGEGSGRDSVPAAGGGGGPGGNLVLDQGAGYKVPYSGKYRLPSFKLLLGDYGPYLLSERDIDECVEGFNKLSVQERFETTYLYTCVSRLYDVIDANGKDYALPPAVETELLKIYGQLESRNSHLEQVALSSAGKTQYTRSYWNSHAAAALSDARHVGPRGQLGRDHSVVHSALIQERAKLIAKNEAARQLKAEQVRGNRRDERPNG